MSDSYQLSSFVLTVVLLPALAQIYLRSRETRTLLWVLGLLCACLRMVQVYHLGLWDVSSPEMYPWFAAAGQSAALIGAVLLLTSFSPAWFSLKGIRIYYAVPFVVPLVLYAVLLDGVYHGEMPVSLSFFIFPALGALALFAGCFWAFTRRGIPTAAGFTLCIITGGIGFWISISVRGSWPLIFVESALHFTTALLIFYLYRRASAGTILAGLGFFGWTMYVMVLVPGVSAHPLLRLTLNHVSVLSKVIAAAGLIVLALESQLARKQSARDREHRLRTELEAYTRGVLSRRRLEDFDRQSNQICQLITANSRFSQAALVFLQPSGQYRLVGAAGLDDAALNGLESLTARIPAEDFLATDSAPAAAEGSPSFALSLEPWLLPGDDLERLHLTKLIAVPLPGRSGTEGAIFLAGLREQAQSLQADDLVPVEVLSARIQASRSQTVLLEKLVDAEKIAGLGQLANNVTRQLNNPLTVILGYASLLEVSPAMTPQERKGVEAILTEARNMRATLESLSRMSRAQSDQYTAISVTELLNDMEQLHRSEFLHRSIDFRLQIAPTLPRALGNAQQVRQAVLYCLQFAIEAVENIDLPGEKSVRIEATAEGDAVKILIAHSGPGFLHPARAFDPFVPAQAAGETAGLGLSLCATILRENNGRITAMNLEPRGAGILLELQAA